MKLNKANKVDVRTHEGSPAYPHLTPIQQLRRSVLSCLLWEDNFYEDGESIADRIAEHARKVSPAELSELAIEARESFNLRHVPLLLVSELAKRGGAVVSYTLKNVIRRPDELSEFLAIYWRDGKTPLSKQVKLGLAEAFTKFDAYSLAKYNRHDNIKLRDVLFLCHAKPKNKAQEQTWKKLINGTLESPDTWEVGLSSGDDKKETFERLLSSRKLGYMALLRNVRNMMDVGVDVDLIRAAILARKGAERVLPFRYVSAARACPQLERYIDAALVASISEGALFDGDTIILVDVSGSMKFGVAGRSKITFMDAAATLASVFPGKARIFTFSNSVVEVPQRYGMAGVDAITGSQPHGGTDLYQAVKLANEIKHDRIIVITDEQVSGPYRILDPKVDKAYMINVASYKNGVGYGKWVHLDGFSEGVIKWIHEIENTN